MNNQLSNVFFKLFIVLVLIQGFNGLDLSVKNAEGSGNQTVEQNENGNAIRSGYKSERNIKAGKSEVTRNGLKSSGSKFGQNGLKSAGSKSGENDSLSSSRSVSGFPKADAAGSKIKQTDRKSSGSESKQNSQKSLGSKSKKNSEKNLESKGEIQKGVAGGSENKENDPKSSGSKSLRGPQGSTSKPSKKTSASKSGQSSLKSSGSKGGKNSLNGSGSTSGQNSQKSLESKSKENSEKNLESETEIQKGGAGGSEIKENDLQSSGSESPRGPQGSTCKPKKITSASKSGQNRPTVSWSNGGENNLNSLEPNSKKKPVAKKKGKTKKVESKLLDEPCAGGAGMLWQNGYMKRVQGRPTFFPVYKVCHNETLGHTFYSQHKINANEDANNKKKCKRMGHFPKGEFFENIPYHDIYKVTSQQRRLVELLGSKEMAEKDYEAVMNNRTYLDQGHLTPCADYKEERANHATNSASNITPMWSPVNRGHWKTIEGLVREYATAHDTILDVWTGSLYTYTVKTTERNVEKDFFLYADGNRGMVPVPDILFKLVYENSTNKAVVFITVNDFYPRDPNHKTYHLCVNYCEAVVGSSQATTLKKEESGFSYCCREQDFRPLFPYYPQFENTQLLTLITPKPV